jgi:hypothetical protein
MDDPAKADALTSASKRGIALYMPKAMPPPKAIQPADLLVIAPLQIGIAFSAVLMAMIFAP